MSFPAAPPASGPAEAAVVRPAAVGRALSPFLRLFMVVVLTLVGTAGSLFAGATAANAAGPRLTAFDDRMLDLVNTARATAGVTQVRAAVGLTNLSLFWSGRMAEGATGYELEHNPDAFEQSLRYGAANRTAWAENVAKWTPTSTTADAIFAAYMDSPGHRANILGASYRYIGIGSVTASNGASFNTMTFTDKVEAGQEYSTPRGSTDSVTVADATIRLSGWAFDPNSSTASIPVHVYVNGAFSTQLTANANRADVNGAYGITGTHGFSGTARAAVGDNTVCVFALSVTGTDNTLLLCKTVNWNPTKPPVGSFDAISLTGSTISLSGWSYDPQNVSASNTVSVKLNGGTATTVTANKSRSDVNAVFGITGSHGYSTSLPARVGANQVCVTATTVGGQATADLGCKSVTYDAAAARRRLHRRGRPHREQHRGLRLGLRPLQPGDLQPGPRLRQRSRHPADRRQEPHRCQLRVRAHRQPRFRQHRAGPRRSGRGLRVLHLDERWRQHPAGLPHAGRSGRRDRFAGPGDPHRQRHHRRRLVLGPVVEQQRQPGPRLPQRCRRGPGHQQRAAQ